MLCGHMVPGWHGRTSLRILRSLPYATRLRIYREVRQGTSVRQTVLDVNYAIGDRKTDKPRGNATSFD